MVFFVLAEFCCFCWKITFCSLQKNSSLHVFSNFYTQDAITWTKSHTNFKPRHPLLLYHCAILEGVKNYRLLQKHFWRVPFSIWKDIYSYLTTVVSNLKFDVAHNGGKEKKRFLRWKIQSKKFYKGCQSLYCLWGEENDFVRERNLKK